MADPLETLQLMLAGVGLTSLPKILQGLQKARGDGAASVPGTQGPPTMGGSEDDALAGITSEEAAQIIPILMQMSQAQRGMGSGPMAAPTIPVGPQPSGAHMLSRGVAPATRSLSPGRIPSFPRMERMDMGGGR